MHLTKRLVLFTTFLVASCFGRIMLKTLDGDKPELAQAVVQILKSCYGDRITAVGIAGNSIGTMSEKMWYQASSPVTLIDGTSKSIKNGPVNQRLPHKLQIFMVTASSSIALAKTLTEIKASIWWNHMAAFLIIDWPFSNNECTNAFEILWTAWETNILDAKFLCYDQTKRPLIYTFNPYTSKAPEIWQLHKVHSGKNGHPWSLFVREYEKDEDICNQLDFEKTNDLGGYEIRATVVNNSYGHEDTISERMCIGLYEEMYCRLFYPTLNATPRLLVHSSMDDAGFVDEKGNPNGILAEVMTGLSDIAFIAQYMTNLANLTATYPHWLCEIRIMSHYSGYKSQLRKISSVVDVTSRAGLGLVSLITLLFFKYILRQSVVASCLSNVRLISNGSLLKIPRKVAPRIYLGSLFIFALTMQGIFQGQLASLLTHDEPLRNVNTREDLVEVESTIYGLNVFNFYFNDPVFKGRFVGVPAYTCTEDMLDSPEAVCANDINLLLFDAAKYKLHISHNSMMNVYAALQIRPDWPLERRVNTIVQQWVEAYLLHFNYDNMMREVVRILEFQENEYKNQGFKILTLEQLSFAFAILGIGLALAITSFISEVAIY